MMSVQTMKNKTPWEELQAHKRYIKNAKPPQHIDVWIKKQINKVAKKLYGVPMFRYLEKTNPHILGIVVAMTKEERKDFFSGKLVLKLGEREKYTCNYGVIELVPNE